MLDGHHGTRLNSKNIWKIGKDQTTHLVQSFPWPTTRTIVTVASNEGDRHDKGCHLGVVQCHVPHLENIDPFLGTWENLGPWENLPQVAYHVPRSPILDPIISRIWWLRACGAPGCQWDALPSVHLKWYCCCVCELVPCCSPISCSCARPHHVALWRTQSSSQSAAQTWHMPLCPRLGAAATGHRHLPLQAALGHQTDLTCCLSLLHQATLL
jgi:hypothetical protein